MLYSLTEYGRYGRNPRYISGVCALDTRYLHVVQVDKDSTWSKNILLIALTMKFTFSKSCVFFSFKAFFLKIDDSLIFFLIQKMAVFLGGYFSLFCYFSIVDLCFISFFGGFSYLTWKSVRAVPWLMNLPDKDGLSRWSKLSDAPMVNSSLLMWLGFVTPSFLLWKYVKQVRSFLTCWTS